MHLNVLDIALKEFVKIFITYWKRAGFIKHNQFFTTMNQLNWFGQHWCFMPEIKCKIIFPLQKGAIIKILVIANDVCHKEVKNKLNLHCFFSLKTVIMRQFFSDLCL